MLHILILKVTKFQLPPPKRFGKVVKNILGAPMSNRVKATFTWDRIHSDSFGIGSTVCARDRFETGTIRFYMGSPS